MATEIVEFSTEAELERWDAFVLEHPDGSFLQTSAWARVKASQGWKSRVAVALEHGEIIAGAQVFRRGLPLGLWLDYVPYGPIGEWSRELLSHLQQSAKDGVLLKVEPRLAQDEPRISQLPQRSFQPRPMLQPEATLLLDLRQSEEELMAGMRQTTRRYIRQAEKAELRVLEDRSHERLREFYEVLMSVNQRKKFGIHIYNYYEKIVTEFGPAVRLFFIQQQDKVLGAYFLIQMGNKSWELYGGVVDEGNKVRANYLLKWRSIQAMKAAGVEAYDQWGVAPKMEQAARDKIQDRRGDARAGERDMHANEGIDPRHPLAGVTYFKEGFGGQRMEWSEGWDWTNRPWLYRLGRWSGRI
jgi:lipid II:glycine glycyltransferase (peptidoglycan interpeptide bridge formation enzyme)